MSAVLTPMQKELHLRDTEAGWAASAFMLGYFLSAPVFGYLGDRFPAEISHARRRPRSGVLATAASGLAHGFAQLFAIRIFVGLGEACFVTMGPSWISDLFAATRRNTAMTFFYVAIPFGSAIGFTIGGWFARSWRMARCLLLRRLARCFARVESAAAPRAAPGRGRRSAGEVDEHAARHAGRSLGTAARTAVTICSSGVTPRRPSPSAPSASGGRPFSIASTDCPWASLDHFRRNARRLRAFRHAPRRLLAATGCESASRRLHLGHGFFHASPRMPVCFFALTVGNATLSLIGLGASMFFLFLPTGPITSECSKSCRSICGPTPSRSAPSSCIFSATRVRPPWSATSRT